jgi:hypothetical protein
MTIPATAQPQQRFKVHWHVLFTHFPISFFGVAFVFQVLHLFVAPTCFELATNVTAILGTIMLIPTTLTGWFTWRSGYRSARLPLFKRKIDISFAMLAVSISLVTWRVILGLSREVPESPSHWVYMAGNTLLIVGSMVEGYYGGRLSHR